MGFLLIALLTQSVVAIYLLWRPFSQQKAEKYLWYLIALFSLHATVKFLLPEVVKNPSFINTYVISFSICYGPLLYLYVRRKLQKKDLEKVTHWIHLSSLLVLPLAYLIVSIVVFFTQNINLLELYAKVAGFAIILSYVGYVSYLLWLLWGPQRRNSEVSWLRIPLVLLLAPFIALFFVHMVDLDKSYIRYMGYLGHAVLILAFLRQTQRKAQPKKTIALSPPTPQKKYEKSTLDPVHINQYLKKAISLMERDKLYLNPDFDLAELASKMDVPKHHLSEVLNTRLDQNFYQFINEYRIQESIQMIRAGESENLLEIAYACGFNSKAAFIKYFKQEVGLTPSQFKKQISFPVEA